MHLRPTAAKPLLVVFLVFFFSVGYTQSDKKSDIDFAISVETPASHLLHIVLTYKGATHPETDFKMPVWTTGYYQLMNFADYVLNFSVVDAAGHAVNWEKLNRNTWQVKNKDQKTFIITYDIKAERSFVASNYVDGERAYISPAGVCMYPIGQINHTVSVSVKPYAGWSTVATGLEPVKDETYAYTAPDFDILYDSPILMGKLETLPSFDVRGIPHYFTGYNLGTFDKQQFVTDLQKIVTSAVNIIGDIPYKHYTFLAIGPGGGGIEHLNSASISFSGQSLAQPASRLKMYTFLAHEYFHHYNVKRIRPIELGPFDYDKGSPTKMLWVSEGLSVYYEYMVVRRAGLMSEDELFKLFKTNILAYEGKPGRLYQSLTEASYNTWSDGPFGRTGDDVNKTISYYEKGPVVGLILDLAIRHASKNKRSLDDVMRNIYKTYYQQKKRGFTEAEFKAECEKVAGSSLDEVFEYTTTTKELDYKKYFSYGGLDVDMQPRIVPAFSGITVRDRGDSLTVSDVEYESPAWKAGLRRRDMIVGLDNLAKPNTASFKQEMANKKTGDAIQVKVLRQQKEEVLNIILGEKTERSFDITLSPNVDALQLAIRKDLLRGAQ